MSSHLIHLLFSPAALSSWRCSALRLPHPSDDASLIVPVPVPVPVFVCALRKRHGVPDGRLTIHHPKPTKPTDHLPTYPPTHPRTRALFPTHSLPIHYPLPTCHSALVSLALVLVPYPLVTPSLQAKPMSCADRLPSIGPLVAILLPTSPYCRATLPRVVFGCSRGLRDDPTAALSSLDPLPLLLLPSGLPSGSSPPPPPSASHAHIPAGFRWRFSTLGHDPPA